jgi:transcriptional regulator with XRE-family HTH domain
MSVLLDQFHLHEGIEFRLARIAAGLTLFDVGVRAGVSPPRLSEFERGCRQLPSADIAR